jgi:glycosyltransferase involved in cell wall biosynthesis
MKLLFVLPEYGAKCRSGISTFYLRMIPGLIKAGCTVDVCLARAGDVDADLKEQSAPRVFGIDAAQVEQAGATLSQFAAFPELWRPLSRAFAAFNICRGREYDIVETTDWDLLYVPWVIANESPPVVVQLHSSNGQVDYHEPRQGSGLTGLTTRLLETSLLGRADELQSYGLRNGNEWSRLLDKEVHHIWPAWYPERDDADVALECDSEHRGLVVGRVQSWKGPEVLCQAMEFLGDKAQKIVWVGGDTPSRRHQQSMSAYLQKTYAGVWGKSILPIGEKSREIVARLQAAAKFIVVPSSWDTFNLTAVEAMWAGKAVICSEGAGASGLISHGENGFRFAPNDARQLAALLNEVGNLSSDALVKIGTRARETVARDMDFERICAMRIDRYRRLKERKPIKRQQHPWLDTLFKADTPEPFEALGDIPTSHIAKLALRRGLRKVRDSIP